MHDYSDLDHMLHCQFSSIYIYIVIIIAFACMQVHIILGLGYFGSEAFNNPLISGVMADVAASANDPIFLNHHAMVDCIFETWLQRNPNAQYPTDNKIECGHKYDNYIVPFFPLYKHSDMFATANNFGYQCIIESHRSNKLRFLGFLGIIPITIIAIGIGLCLRCCRKCKKRADSNPKIKCKEGGEDTSDPERRPILNPTRNVSET